MDSLVNHDDITRQADSAAGAEWYDVQQEREDLAVVAGIADFRLISEFSLMEHSLHLTLSITTSTSDHRGAHMSRLVAAARTMLDKKQTIEEYLLSVCREVESTQPGAAVTCRFELPYMDQFVGVTITASRSGDSPQSLSYSFRVGGLTSCPCSRRIAGVGHMQRATLELETESVIPLSPSFSKIIATMAECFSAKPEAFLKRYDEARTVIRAQENSKFVEDVVRECVRRFPGAKRIEATALESMHAHNAIAIWTRPMGRERKGTGDTR